MARDIKSKSAPKRTSGGISTTARKRGPATREIILDEALKLFAHKGYEATSVRDISRAVGVSDAALYRHFPAKNEIALELFSYHYGRLAQKIRRISESGTSFSETIHQLVDLLCTLYDDAPAVFTFILLSQHEYLRFVGNTDNAVVEIINVMQHAKARGDIVIKDPELAAAIALGMAIQPAIFKLYGRLPGVLSARRTDIGRAILNALGHHAD